MEFPSSIERTGAFAPMHRSTRWSEGRRHCLRWSAVAGELIHPFTLEQRSST
jgi:hypothetical protein